jgi:DHA1 family multidrug resistance protein-like MFS transporter
MGLFGGHIVAGMSLVSTAAPMARLGWALGWLTTAQLAGTLLGPLIGGSIADAFGSFRAPFLGAGTASLLVGMAIMLVPKQASTARRTKSASSDGTAMLFKKYGDLGALVVVLLLAQSAVMAPQPIVSLHVRELVGLRPDLATLAGFAFSVIGLSGLLAAPLIGTLSDAVGARRLLLVVVVGAAVCTMPQAYASSYAWFVTERFLAGLFFAGIIPIVNTLIGRTIAESDRGRAYGITSGATFLGAFLGPVSGGLIGARFGLSSVFLVTGGTLFIAAIWIRMRLSPTRVAP